MDIDSYLKQLENDLNSQLENLGMESGVKKIGEALKKKNCPFCGEELLADADFCPYCGNELKEEIQSDIEEIESHEVEIVSYEEDIESCQEEIESCEEDIESYEGEKEPIYKLNRYDELEEETKTKIGTFERLYQQLYQQETGRGLIEKFDAAYEKLDFASLVNLLASAIEIELKESVLNFMRKEYGAKFEFTFGKARINLEKEYHSLRLYQFCLYYDEQNGSKIRKYGLEFNQIKKCLKVLDHIIPIRNDADHTKHIDKYKFLKFYNYVYAFFQEYMKYFILLKTKLRNDVSSFSSNNGIGNNLFNIQDELRNNTFNINKLLNNFTQDDEDYLKGLLEDNDKEPKKENSKPISRKKGIIITDTQLLARKFFDKDSYVNEEGNTVDLKLFVRKHLIQYMECMAMAGFDYFLLDVSELEPSLDNRQLSSWQDYAAVLNYMNEDFDITEETIGLFIVGGNDVVPVPQVLNPLNDCSESEKYLESDLLYAFYNNKIEKLTFKDNKVDVAELLKRKPSFWVGRLPLENGLVDASYDDFANYFNRAVKEFLHFKKDDDNNIQLDYLGINSKKHVATICESTELVSKRVFEGIPLQPQDERIGFVKNNMFVSPVLDLRIDGSRKEDYKQAVRESDMLSFILHGSAYPSMDSYYGEVKDKSEGGYQAFSPDLFINSNVKVVSGICCWGGRYVGFSRTQSALLKAMFSNVLLFLGSSRSACGVFDVHMEKYGCDISLAETLLKYYLNYLLQGYSAGEALVLAKMLQLSHPDCEDINLVLGTILEFNLFGDPFLALVPQLKRKPIEIVGSVEGIDESSFTAEYAYQVVYDKEEENKLSLLDRLRRKVDNNLQEIRRKINDQLYAEFNIEPDTLETVCKYQIKNGSERYRFCYNDKSEYYDNKTYVEADKDGIIKSIVSTL